MSYRNIADGELDRDLRLILVGELHLELALELALELTLELVFEQTTLLIASLLAFLSRRPISMRSASSSSSLFLSASASCRSLLSSLSSLTSSMFSLRKFLGECGLLRTGTGRGRAAVVAMLSILERELVLLRGGGELAREPAREFAAEVFGVLWREVSSLKPRPEKKREHSLIINSIIHDLLLDNI